MIKINKIPDQEVNIFYKDNLVGKCHNELEFNDLRLQIVRDHATGYYVEYDNNKWEILANGNLECWPEGLYDKNVDIMSAIVREGLFYDEVWINDIKDDCECDLYKKNTKDNGKYKVGHINTIYQSKVS